MGVRNVLVEGVSGSGKTSVAEELARRGHHVVHGDRVLAYQGDPLTGVPTPGHEHGHHVWDVAEVRRIAADHRFDLTFFCGGSRNWARFLDVFDVVLVLGIDRATLDHRLDARPADEFGHLAEERALVLRVHATGEDQPPGATPLDATRPLAVVVDDLLRLCAASPPQPRSG